MGNYYHLVKIFLFPSGSKWKTLLGFPSWQKSGKPGIEVYWDRFLEVELDLRNISPHKTVGQLSHQATDVVLFRPFAVGTHSLQMWNDMPMTVHSHAGVGGSIFPLGALHHVGQPLRSVCLAPGAGLLFIRGPILLEAGLVQGEGHGLEEPA